MPRSFGLLSTCLLAVLLFAGCGHGHNRSGTSTPSTPPSTLPTPTLSGVAPGSGPLAGSTPLTLSGVGFASIPAGPVMVLVGDRAVMATVVDDTTITATSPAGAAAGPVDVTLVHPGGTSSLAGVFSYDPTPPSMVSTPPAASAAGGTLVTLDTTAFTSLAGATVTVGGMAVPAGDVTVVDADTVQFAMPAGLTPGAPATIELTAGAEMATSSIDIAAAVAAGDLVINEFLANAGTFDANRDGTASATGDEFVEIVNLSATALDLSGLEIHDAVGVRHVFPNPTALPAGGAIVVFAFGNPQGFAPRHSSGQALVSSTGTLALNNGGDTIEIRTAGGATVLFGLTYGTTTTGESRNNSTDGGAITSPATAADYTDHSGVAGAVGVGSPGTRVDGSDF